MLNKIIFNVGFTDVGFKPKPNFVILWCELFGFREFAVWISVRSTNSVLILGK